MALADVDERLELQLAETREASGRADALELLELLGCLRLQRVDEGRSGHHLLKVHPELEVDVGAKRVLVLGLALVLLLQRRVVSEVDCWLVVGARGRQHDEG